MHLKQIMKRAVAWMLALSLLLSLTACSSKDALNAAFAMAGISMEVVPGERLHNSTWINSDLEGSIDENTELNLKDDFHTAVNRDWLLAHDSQEDEIVDTFTVVDEALTENQFRLLTPGAEFDPDPNVMSKETLDHLQDLILDMMELAGNQEKRNELGVAPLIPYLEAIEQIDSMDGLTEYLKNTDNRNFTNENFFNFYVDIPNSTRDFYTVHIKYPLHTLLTDFEEYSNVSFNSYMTFQMEKAAVEYVLGGLGYEPRQIKKFIQDCYAFESGMSYVAPHPIDLIGNYSGRSDKIYTLEDIRKVQGDFPLTELLEAAGVAHSESFRIYEPGLLNYMGSYYKERNLEKFKAYFIVHTVLEALPYLDETCQAMHQDILAAAGVGEDSAASDSEQEILDPEELEEERINRLFSEYIVPLLYEPFQLTYIGSYCTSAAKQDILDMLEQIRGYYIELLRNTDWLSQATRDLAIEKVEKMGFCVMYPDVLPDYSGLVYHNYDKGGNLLDAVAAINRVNGAPSVEKVNQPIKRTDWDLNSMSTLEINAANYQSLNSIVIFAGILAGGVVYDENASVEHNYGCLGVILGHEVTHAFDTNGYTLDAEGLPYGWWTNEDEVAFRLRADKLANYYSGLYVYPGMQTTYDGQRVKTEAISDMGGMKCMLALAEEIPDFDYDLFFRAYASTWRNQTSMTTEMERSADVHPFGFLRTNVTLQQFEEFYETYDIGPGDGMYLAPEDRILVW